MDFNEYQALALRTSDPEATRSHDFLHAGLGMATEAAEFLDVLKKQHAYGKPLDLVNLAEEVGDILWYCALAARALGIPLSELAAINIAKLQERYPKKFTEEQALVRNLDAERTLLEAATTLGLPIPEGFGITPTLTTMPAPRPIPPAEFVKMSEPKLMTIPLGGGMDLRKTANVWEVISGGQVIARTNPGSKFLNETDDAMVGPWLMAAQSTLNSVFNS